MPGNESVIGEEGLRFFGTMTASISHELKNALSIINEGAGLLEDLAAMSARGMALDPARRCWYGCRAEVIMRFSHGGTKSTEGDFSVCSVPP